MRADTAWQATDSGLRVRVRLTPRAGRDRLEGIVELPAGAALKAAVSPPPEGGKANAALIKLLAKTLRVARTDIAIAAGASARTKLVDIAGDGAALAAVLEAEAAGAAAGRRTGKREA